MFIVSNSSVAANNFCKGCNYTIVIEIDEDCIVKFDGKSYSEMETIKLNDSNKDGILNGENLIYNFTVDNKYFKNNKI